MEYISIKQPIQSELTIKKSKFITNLIPICNMEDAILHIKNISKIFFDATHNCYAYIADELGQLQRFSDDGEPSGTAGQPMLEILKKRNFSKILAIVTRYYGGIKLGANGLIGAYTNSIRDALDKAEIVSFIYSNLIEIETNYSIYKLIVIEIEKNYGIIRGVNFAMNVKILFSVGVENTSTLLNGLQNILLGKLNYHIIETKYF